MHVHNKNALPHLENWFLLLSVAGSIALACILLPLYGAILWGAIIGLLQNGR